MKKFNVSIYIYLLLLTPPGLLFFSCHHNKNRPENVPAGDNSVGKTENDKASQSSQMVVEGLTGSLSRDEVETIMNQDGIMKLEMCMNWIYTKRDYIFGKIELLFKIDVDGKVAKVKFLRSELGDYELEKCLLHRLSFIKFPKPKGGATEVTYSFTVDLPGGTKKPDNINSSIVKEALKEFEPEIKECTGGKLGGLTLVLYLGETFTEEINEFSNKKKRKTTKTLSHIVSIGGIAPDGAREDAMQCIFDASKKWKIPIDAGSYILKSTIIY